MDKILNTKSIIEEVLNDINLKHHGRLILKDISIITNKNKIAVNAILEHEEVIENETIRYTLRYFYDLKDSSNYKHEVIRTITAPYASSIGNKENRFGNLCEAYTYHSKIDIKNASK